MIKTVELTTNVEQKVEFTGGLHLKIKNLGEDTVYISQHDGIVAGADGVKSIQAQTTDIVTDVAKYSIEGSVGDYRGSIYALAPKDCKIELEPTNNPNFKFVKKGGGDGGSIFTESKELIQVLNDNVEIFIGTKEEI